MQELFRAIHVGDQEKIRKEAIKETEKLHKNAATISQYNLATMEIVSGFFFITSMTSTSSSTRITLYCSILILLFCGAYYCSFIIAEDCSLLNE